MYASNNNQRSVLQRRSSISNTIQAALDGSAIIGLAWLLIDYHIGLINAEYTLFLLVLVVTVAIVYDQFAIYRNNASLTRKALNLFQAWTLSFGILVVLGFLTKQNETYSRILVAQLYVLGFLAQIILHIVVRALQASFLKHAVHSEKTIIIGTGRLASFLSQKITANPWLGQKVLGCIRLNKDTSLPAESDGMAHPKILGHIDDLMALIEQEGVRTVYFAIPLDASEVLEDVYFGLLDKHVAVHWIPDIFSLRLVNHSVREIAGIPVLTLSETPLTGTRLLLKSAEDLLFSSIILLLIAPLLGIIALAIKLDSEGPVFFRQSRNGWNGKTFRIWKFRSMYVHPVEGGVIKQAEKNDPRITKVGAFLRKTSLDELPQIFNVLKGEMSLVGPRPHAVQHDEEYSKRISDYFARHQIKPGITGLAQVRGLRGETKGIEQMILRVESDIEYINNWSLWLDISILVRTTSAFTGKNAY